MFVSKRVAYESQLLNTSSPPLGDHTISPIKSTGAVAKISSAKRPQAVPTKQHRKNPCGNLQPSYRSTNSSWQYPAFHKWFFTQPFGWSRKFSPTTPGNNIATRCPNGHIEGKKNVECENHILSKRQRSGGSQKKMTVKQYVIPQKWWMSYANEIMSYKICSCQFRWKSTFQQCHLSTWVQLYLSGSL